jgi:transcriptional regulator with XRE-family HTH domain
MNDEEKKQLRARIGSKIATLRESAGMTQEQLAVRAGLQPTHVDRIETGKYNVTLETLQTIAEQFDMKVDIV